MSNLNLLTSWTTHAGINKKNLEENGRLCAFLFNNTFSISIEAPAYSDDVFIVIELVPIGIGELKRKRLEIAMTLNAYALETRGGVIGWDNVSERIILSYRANAESTNAVMLDNIITNLVEVAEMLKPVLEMNEEIAKTEVMNKSFDNMFQPITH